MTKADIINEIAEKTGVDKADVTASVEAFFSVVKSSMSNGNNIYIRGFGSFINKKRKKKIPSSYLGGLMTWWFILSGQYVAQIQIHQRRIEQ